MTYTYLTPTVGTVVLWRSTLQSSRLTPQLDHLAAVIKEQGCRLLCLEQANRVAQAVIEQTADLLLIQLQDSETESQTFCQSLRQQPTTRHLPVLFVGTRDAKREEISALRCGGNGYLQLPITPEACWLLIERHIQMSQLVRKLQTDRLSLSQKVSEFSQILRQQEQLQVALAQENKNLQKIAFIDGLTQVANRRSFNETSVRLWAEALEEEQPISLLLCDIDYFKRYNDTYGHQAGDVCLQRIAAALVEGAHRQDDQVSRYGGEEFAVLLPKTDIQGAQQVALAIQSAVANAQIPHKGSLIKSTVSLSIGVCTLIPDAQNDSCEMFISRADQALYTAKLSGRDRTVIDTPAGLISLSAPQLAILHPLDKRNTQPSKATALKSIAPKSIANRNNAVRNDSSTNSTIDAIHWDKPPINVIDSPETTGTTITDTKPQPVPEVASAFQN
ncbi:MAG: diguanylate cyclase [Cyanobacteria bacterium J06632_3]